MIDRFPRHSVHQTARIPGGLGTLLLAALVVLGGPLLPRAAEAQDLRLPAGATDQRVDRIAAVVGDSVIFMTDIEEELIRIAAQGGEVPTDPEGRALVRRELLDGLVNQQLLLQAAARDTMIVVPDDRVETALRGAWEDEIRRWGSETALREELDRSQGLSLAQYRGQLRDDIRRQILIQTFIQSQRRQARPIAVSDAEVDAFFQSQREVLARRPATMTFNQVFVQPSPGDSAMAAASAEIERIFALVRDGEDFESLARQFSADEGSRTQGGDLGWYRRGENLVREFEDAAFSTREGAMVGPVLTQFGAHLIRVERVRGAERRIRHILIGADVTSEDLARSRARAEEIRDRMREGAPVSEFAEERRNLPLADSLEVPTSELQNLPPALASQLLAAAEGDVVGPLEFPLGPEQSAWAVFRVIRIRDEGEYSIDDLRGQIRQRLQAEKAEARMLEDLRSRTYVDIRI
ncbi:peptidylprolyl isomerase [soil metagenome]